MVEPRVDVTCPACGAHFLLSLGEALSPLVEIEIERRLALERQDIIAQAREAAAQESDQRNQVLIGMKDKIIADMRVQIDELRRKADSGSQQLQGEVEQLALEHVLQKACPSDRILPVERGRAGGDVIQEVVGVNGSRAGAILWECKQTREWSNAWVAKAKQDMRAAKASLCVIATAALPKGVEIWARIDGIVVVSLRCVLPMAHLLRQVLLDIAAIRAASKQGQAATDKLFCYVTGPQFHRRVTAIMEGCIALQGDLDSDKRATARRWARTQQHIDVVVQNAGAIHGDLQGLLGGALPDVAGLALGDGNDPARRAS